MRWSYNEDKYCCDEFVRKYIIEKDYTSSSIFAYNLSLKLKGLDEGSIKMKISNIVYITNFLKINHTCDIAPLCNYSDQNIIALGESLRENNIPFDRELVRKIIQQKKSH